MLIGGSLAMLVMATAGGMVTNHGWREAQREEIDGALRAGVSAAAHFMRGDLTKVEEDIKERVAGFMRGLLGDITIANDDITVDHDFATNQTTIRVEGNAAFAFSSLWGTGTSSLESLKGEYVIVALDVSQYEFALALDVSKSMGSKPTGWTVTRLDALKATIRTIAQTVDAVSQTNPGIVTLSLVPYANAVNVADTSGASQTAAKERYVHMLTGAEYSTQTSRNTEAHWVDTFQTYGTGGNMGPLASRSLPDFLAVADWNLHQPGTEDVSSQAPTVGTWSFEGEDFWNGCVIARWGAYWDPAARPAAWDPSDTDNWPAKTTVSGWEPGSTGIPDLPLHLSDAPPDASNPSTRFTAYSWPDARINGLADGALNDVLIKTLDPSYDPARFGYLSFPASGNHWHLRALDRGGSLYCPEAPIVPLTDDLTALQAADHYDFVDWHSRAYWGQTFLHLGIVWGLRTLSPLWSDVWNTKSASGDDLPRTPCLDGGTTQGCSPFVEKAIIIISDGANYFGQPRRGRRASGFQPGTAITGNPDFRYTTCSGDFYRTEYETAMTAGDAATFAGSFDVDANGVFTAAGMSAVLDGFQAVHPTVWSLDPSIPADRVIIDAHRILWENALKDMTPWQLFRGYDDDSPTKTTDATDALADSANQFGFQGRPAQNGHYCRPTSPFSAYGRPEDLVRVGDSQPVSDAAPFSVPAWLTSSPTRDLQDPITDRLDDWFREACSIAGQRGVRIHAIYIGDDTQSWSQAPIALLEECVDRGYGGNPVVAEVHATPTEQELKDTIEDIIDIRRTLRFIGP